jgi:hypothetical protein
MTITATTGGTDAASGITLAVKVLDGALEAGGVSAQGMAIRAAEASITPRYSSALPVFALQNASAASPLFTLASSNKSYNNAALGSDYAYADGYYSGTVTHGTPITVGSTSPTSDTVGWAIYEVPPATSLTPTVDTSSPAFASAASAKTITTASFTPPPGSVLVAMVTANGTGEGGAVSMAVSGGGLTWTQRAVGTVNGDGIAAIFTATVPSSSHSGAATLAAGVSLTAGAFKAREAAVTLAVSAHITSGAVRPGYAEATSAIPGSATPGAIQPGQSIRT